MQLENKKVLVTGGAGFIGSHTVDGLLKQGAKVTVVDNLTTGRKVNLNPAAKFYDLNLASEDVVKIMQSENHKFSRVTVQQFVTDGQKAFNEGVEAAKVK